MITLNDLPQAEKDMSCQKCKSKNIKSEIKDIINHTPCEKEYTCKDCGTVVAYWGYGAFEFGGPDE